MKRISHLTATLAAGAILLFGTMASAKNKTASKSTAPPKAAASQSSGQKNHHGQAPGMAVDHSSGNGVAHMANSGSVAGNPKSGENPDHPPQGSAGQSSGQKNHHGQAPGMAVDHPGGNTPKAEPKSGGKSAGYKDPEDMTTRYRPGNNKTKAAGKKAKHRGATASQQ